MNQIAIIALAVFMPVAAQAAMGDCFPRQIALDKAKAQFGELPAFTAQTLTGNAMSITVNPVAGDWSLWAHPNTDTMCLIGGGKGWAVAVPPVVAPVEPETAALR